MKVGATYSNEASKIKCDIDLKTHTYHGGLVALA
jgi:hypothetical protein